MSDKKEMRIKANPLNILILAGFLTLGKPHQIVLAQCPEFYNGVRVGTVADSLLKEVSGISASRHSPGVMWGHNDSGGLARVWAFNTRGTDLGTYNLAGATARDWEDMAIGPGPVPGQDYLYIADLGDNDGLIDFTFTIYRVTEPNVSACQEPVDTNLNNVDALPVKYPDSVRHDCETILVDPLNGDIYICTRDRWGDDQGIMKIYLYPAPQTPGVTFTMQYVIDAQLINGEMAVGGDVLLDGSSVIIRTKGTAMRCLLWQRNPGTMLWQAFNNPVCVVPQIDEPQGEAISFEADGCGYYTVSEGLNQPIYYFARNGICLTPTIAGDLNWDGNVNTADLAVLASHWLKSCFTCQDFITVDDFESYNNTADIETQWYDYIGAPTQTLETQEVYHGAKAMKIDYSNDNQLTIRKDLGVPQDWSIHENAKIQFKGQTSNRAKDIILTLLSATGDSAASAIFIGGTKERDWTSLEIVLDSANPLLENIQYIDLTINADSKSGTVYFDNLEVIRTEPVFVCNTPINEDLNDDCQTDMLDFTLLAENWMK
jgi:hypothetical protein